MPSVSFATMLRVICGVRSVNADRALRFDAGESPVLTAELAAALARLFRELRDRLERDDPEAA